MRKTVLKRVGRIKPNAKRKKRLFRENFGGKDYRDYIVSLPCAICGVEGFSDPAHVKSRGSGGKADKLVPLCHRFRVAGGWYCGCHVKFDERRWTLPEGTEERLKELAAKLHADFHTPSTENTPNG